MKLQDKSTDLRSDLRSDLHSGSVEQVPPQLAEGTRRDINTNDATSLCIATHCETVDQFVATYQRYFDGSKMFVPNAQRAVGTIVRFSFQLNNKDNALVGKGTVVEQLTGMDNPFGRAGLLLAIQKLGRDSVPVMQRMLAESKLASIEPTKVRDIKIPSLAPKQDPKPRANTVLGIPIVAKLPMEFKVPAVPKKIEARRTIADGTPRPVLLKPQQADGVPRAIPSIHDTTREEIPFALRHQLMLLEQRAAVVPVHEVNGFDFDLDSAWDDPVPAIEANEPAPIVPEAVAEALDVPEAVGVPEVVAVEAVPVEDVEPAVAEELPVERWSANNDFSVDALGAEAPAFDQVAAPTTVAVDVDLDAEPVSITYPWWHEAMRWTTRVLVAATVFVGTAATTLLLNPPPTVASKSAAMPATSNRPDPFLSLSTEVTPPNASPAPAAEHAPPVLPAVARAHAQVVAPAAISPKPHTAQPAPRSAAKVPVRLAPKHATSARVPCRTLDCL